MSISTIDTHAMVKQLVAAGFTNQQAEAVTSAVRQAQDIDLSNLATKADLAELRLFSKADLAELRSSSKSDLAETKAEIIKWVVGIGFAQAGFVVAMIKLMH